MLAKMKGNWTTLHCSWECKMIQPLRKTLSYKTTHAINTEIYMILHLKHTQNLKLPQKNSTKSKKEHLNTWKSRPHVRTEEDTVLRDVDFSAINHSS